MSEQGLILDYGQFLLAASRALDAVEFEVLGAAQNHAKRVAYLSVKLGRRLGLESDVLSDMAAYAALHDNALTEYITAQRRKGADLPPSQIREDFRFHCQRGEENVSAFPFLCPREHIILYHHENFDGSGFFGLSGEHIPLMARLLRLTDQVDVLFNLARWSPDKLVQINRHLDEKSGCWYDPQLLSAFQSLLSAEQSAALTDEAIERSLQAVLPPQRRLVSYGELIQGSATFSHIIDYKSPFTLHHSQGIAEKTKQMAAYYELDANTSNEVYIAAFLHDIGKLAVPDALLEKPGKLTGAEFDVVKQHVLVTHEILSVVSSFDRIARWASSHHERLDGSGYFRGTTGNELDFCSRLLCCIDVYQALVEDRPYRQGMSPDRAMEILREQAKSNKLDRQIVSDIGRVFLS